MFIEKCFIRKYSQELVNKLVEIGHNVIRFPEPRYIICDKNNVYLTSILPDKDINKYTDCDTNEKLFLALAALRDDIDYMQWFTDGEKWLQDKRNDIEVIRYGAGNPIKFHKATVEEIIKYFK